MSLPSCKGCSRWQSTDTAWLRPDLLDAEKIGSSYYIPATHRHIPSADKFEELSQSERLSVPKAVSMSLFDVTTCLVSSKIYIHPVLYVI